MTEEDLSGVGAELARAREAQGLTHLDVAQQLKFAPRQIEALEQERFAALPGPTIARGMLRNYARLLELDADAVLARLGERLEAPDAARLAARFRQPVPFSDSARRSTLMYVGMSLIVLLAVGAMGYEWHRERNAARELAFVSAAKLPLETPRAALPPAPAFPAPAIPAPLARERIQQVQKLEKAESIEKPEPIEKAEAIEKAAAKQTADPAGMQRIVLNCEEESWIELTDGLDRVLVWALLPAGSERVLEGQPPFSLVVGNARHVQVTYEGRPIDLRPRTRGDVARLTLE